MHILYILIMKGIPLALVLEGFLFQSKASGLEPDQESLPTHRSAASWRSNSKQKRAGATLPPNLMLILCYHTAVKMASHDTQTFPETYTFTNLFIFLPYSPRP